MISKIFIVTVFVVGANCFYLKQEYNRPGAIEELQNFYSEQPFHYIHPIHVRERRKIHGVVNTNPDGTMGKLPLAGNDKNILSAVGGLDGAKFRGDFGAGSAGLALDNVNGHGLSLTDKHIPNFVDQLTTAAKLNLVNTYKHDFNINTFTTRTLPNNPVMPNFSTYGGGVDYMFDKKVGASLGVTHTPQWQKTDYSALGKLNLFHDRSSALDFSAGASKSMSPFILSRSCNLPLDYHILNISKLLLVIVFFLLVQNLIFVKC